MSKEENVDKIKAYIDEVLGTKSSLRNKLPIKKSTNICGNLIELKIYKIGGKRLRM